MFKKDTSNPAFPNIVFFDTVVDRFISTITDVDAVSLNQKIEKAKSGEDAHFYEAMLAAKKMAVYYGVPGLLQYVNLNIMNMIDEKTQGEIVQQQAFNTYIYLHLAEKLYMSDPAKFDNLIAELLPNQNLKLPGYWQAKKEELMELGHFESYVQEAIDEGDRMFSECKPSESRVNVK